METDFFVDTFQSPFGLLRIEASAEHLLSVRWQKTDGPSFVHTSRNALLVEARAQLDAYFRGDLKDFHLPYTLTGTPFQLSVWHALMDIPYGKTVCYQDIAVRIGSPGASRAVGMANHQNPLALVVPCHRVVGKNRTLTGYAGGLNIKQALLDLEYRYANHENFLF